MFLSLTHLKPAVLLRCAGLSILALLAAGTLATAAPARSDLLSARTHPITIAVLGDSVAHDLGRGMQDLFAENGRVRVVRQTKFATGLVRTDYYNWNKVARDFLRSHKPNVVFIVMGGNDHQTIRRRGKRYDPDTKAWRGEYARLVSHFMNNFSRSHTKARIYWVSLPPVRSSQAQRRLPEDQRDLSPPSQEARLSLRQHLEKVSHRQGRLQLVRRQPERRQATFAHGRRPAFHRRRPPVVRP